MGERHSVSLSSKAKIVEAYTEAKAEALPDFRPKLLLSAAFKHPGGYKWISV